MLVRQEDPAKIRRGIALLEEAYALNYRLFDGYHVELAYNRNNAAIGYYALEEYAAAEAYSREAVDMASNFLDDGGALAGMKTLWARSLARLGREEEARQVLNSLLQSLESFPENRARRDAARELLEELDA
jgi:hypothetical protein